MKRIVSRITRAYHSEGEFTIREFGPDVAQSLASRGFAVVDDAISARTSAALRAEIEQLHEEGALRTNASHFVASDGTTTRLAKRHVLERELHTLKPPDRAALPALCGLEADPTIRALLSVYHPRLTLREQALKAQRNAGSGGCFPLHVDSARAVDARRVTALLYLNDEWDGGALRLYPFPSPPVDVAPEAGCLVLLSATRMLHRVLPAFRPRYAVTLWLSGDYRTNAPPQLPLVDAGTANVDDIAARILLSTDLRCLTARIALADEWDASLRDAHAPHEADAAIAQHQIDRRKIVERLPGHGARLLPDNYALKTDVHDRIRQLLSSPKDLVCVLQSTEATHEWL